MTEDLQGEKAIGRRENGEASINPAIDKTLEERFTQVFNEKLWGDGASISGPGSLPGSAMWSRGTEAIHTVINQFGLHTMADCPCGDFVSASSALEMNPTLQYVGYDIVAGLIEANRVKYPDRRFEQFDIVSDVLPKYDLVFCKELLIHLTNSQIFAALSNIKKSGSNYFMASNSFGVTNEDLVHAVGGQGRPVDLMKEPFNLPNLQWNNPFFALWKCEDLPG